MPLPLTQGLGEFIAAPGFQEVPADLISQLRIGFIDTLACLMSGRRESVTQIARQLVAQRGSASQARALLGQERFSIQDAAFVNAVAAHALDYDDMALNGHPSVVLVPALLAFGEMYGSSDAELLRAYLVGYEIWAELTGREKDSMHNKGWHPTSVLGTVAVAGAVAHLARLNSAQAAHALGIAASMASGLMGNFGSMTKPLHAGWAARHGIEAVQLAQAGVTASPDVLESAAGFLAAFSPKGQVDRGTWAQSTALRFRHTGLSIKKYPVCYASHRIIDGVIALRNQHGFKASDIENITATLSEVNARILHSHFPKTALEAKFSLEFACAMAACDGAVGLTQVNDEQVFRQDIQALMKNVHVQTVAPGCPIEPSFALNDQVYVRLKNGAQFDSGPIRFARGHALFPLSEDDIRTKFLDCFQTHEQGRAQKLLNRLERLQADHAQSLCSDLKNGL